MGTFNSDINAVEKAVKERVLYVSDGSGGFCRPPKPTDYAFQSLWENYKDQLTPGKFASPLTEEEFLRAYDGRKRTIYEKAIASLKSKPLCKHDSRVKYFMKVEKVNFTAKPDSVPRGISPRDPRFHVTFGRYIKRIEKSIYKSVDNIWGSTTVMKGYNAKQRGMYIKKKWDELLDPVAVGIDASRFDQHVSKDALQFEHNVYSSYYVGKDNKSLRRLCTKQLVNEGVSYAQDGKLKFKVEGVRMSGDMNTSLGNVLLMCMMTHDLRSKSGIPFTFVNDGDDGVLFMERKHLKKLHPLLEPHYREYGFKVVLEEPVYELEHIEFCQCKPVMVDELRCVMVRNVEISFDKDTTCILPLNKTSAPKWATAVGQCGLSLAANVPVLREFYRFLSVQSDKTIKLTSEGWLMMARGMNAEDKVTQYARYSYWKAFGVSPDKQIAQENYYKNACVKFALQRTSKHAIPLQQLL